MLPPLPPAGTVVQWAETVAPKLGVLTALLLFLSPAAAVRETFHSNMLCDLNPLPIALMAVTTSAWLAYGIALQDFYVSLANLPGVLLSVTYLIAMLPVMQINRSGAVLAENKTNRHELRLVQSILLAGTVTSVLLWTGLRFFANKATTAKNVLGLFASAITIAMNGSPLSTVKTVITQKNSASILSSLTIAQIVNATLWTVYGSIVQQVFVWGPNCIGLGLGLVQLALKLAYPSSPVCELPDDFLTSGAVPTASSSDPTEREPVPATS